MELGGFGAIRSAYENEEKLRDRKEQELSLAYEHGTNLSTSLAGTVKVERTRRADLERLHNSDAPVEQVQKVAQNREKQSVPGTNTIEPEQ